MVIWLVVVCAPVVDVFPDPTVEELAADALSGHRESAVGAADDPAREYVDVVGRAPVLAVQDVLACIEGLPVDQMSAFGDRAGRRTRRLGEEPDDVGAQLKRKRHARFQGFDLHAGAPTKAHERDRLERMLRYLLRPPIAESRLRELPDGTILLGQKTKWSDGTTHLVFEPLELLERLAAIIPRPQVNLVIYHGVLAPNAKWRDRAVAYGRPEAVDSGSNRRDGLHARPPGAEDVARPRPRYYAWADLMRRTFGYDVMACLHCGGRMKLLAMIDRPDAIERILSHLGLPTEPPRALPARAPPERPEQLDLPEPDASFDW